MGVQLYRIGTTHEIRGVPCELKTFRPHAFKDALDSDEGWKMTPEELYPKTKIKKKESKISEISEEDDDLLGLGDISTEDEGKALDLEVLSNAEIRDLAKDAGIKNWKQGNLAKLKKVLSDT